jgi:integrase
MPASDLLEIILVMRQAGQTRHGLRIRALIAVPLFCVIDGSTSGRPSAATAARAELRRLAAAAGVGRRFAPHQLRHRHAVELAREGVPVNIIQRQLGHTDLGTTSTYLTESTRRRSSTRSTPQPTISATAGLSL